jgi:hypothetical protein
MPDNCPHCGVALAWATRSCPRCGARFPDPVSNLLDPRPRADEIQEVERDSWADEPSPDEPEPTPDPTVEARHGRWSPRRWWAQPRHRALVAIAVCGVVLGVAVGLAFAIGNQAVDTNRVVPAKPTARRHPRRLTAVPATAPAISPDEQREIAYLSQLESVLQQAAAGSTVLVGTLRGAPATCAMPPGAAATLIHTVVQNRTNLRNALGALAPAPNPESQRLEQLLAAALHASSQADGEYEAWLDANGVTDPQSCSPSSTPAIALYWNSARASDSTASTAKAAFVAAFNPVAVAYSLPTWTASQF